jgi:Fe-Mn family superoxide dismutase
MEYTLPPLPYAFDALEPYIDARTMEIHYTKHHQAYVDRLNEALKGHDDMLKLSLEELLKRAHTYAEPVKTALINNGGGHANHSFFWKVMKPNGGGVARGAAAQAIDSMFGSFQAFQEKFNGAAKTVFGSGWAWLCMDKQGKLVVMTTPNQNSPIMEGLSPILGLDVWEHAYYLQYQNKRPDYIQSWWNVVNWDFVEENYRTLKDRV